MSIRQVVLDFESYYSKDYTLRKMTPVEYILDPRFELTGCAIKEDGADSYFLSGDEFNKWVVQAKLEDAVVISHNALFDMCILSWRHSVLPRLMVDTLGMARATVYHLTGSVSLENVARCLGLPPKGNTIQNVIGMNAAAIRQAGLWESYAEYARHDADLCWEIYQRLRKDFPISELSVMDAVLRCAVAPKFMLDRDVLSQHRAQVIQQKHEVLAKAMLVSGLGDKAELMSNDKFAELLRSVGCEPPTKTSKVTGKVTWAFAKTDQGMIDLEEHPNPAVQALVAARLGNKTTLEETRAERLLSISNLHWGNGVGRLPYTTGYMPIPLRYSGAHTHRLSGDWKLNLQNLPRGGNLRKALKAPHGYEVITVDSSQIEARIVACISGQDDLVESFALGNDVYSEFASELYGRAITKADKPERFIGKGAILGLGFGMGGPRFYAQAVSGSYVQGIQLGDDFNQDFADRAVHFYRKVKYPRINAAWDALKASLPEIASGSTNGGFGPVAWEKQAVRLPNGLRLFYRNLRFDPEWQGWVFEYGKKTKRLFGGKLMENIVQALARIIVMDAAVRIQKRIRRMGLELAMQVHDELVYVVPSEFSPVVKQILQEEMTVAPAFMPNLPLACEIESGPNYGEAKK